VSEEALPEPGRTLDSHLHYIGEGEEPVPEALQRDLHVASELAREHTWLVDRLVGRIAARWPDGVDVEWVRSHAMIALTHVAARVDHEDDIPVEAVPAVGERIRTLLGGSQWYREAMLGRARPLCEAWRGAVLAGREPTDQTLCARLRLSMDDLIERYVELASVFAVEPAALVPGGRDLAEGLALAIGGLPNEQQLVLSLYLDRQLTLSEVAEVLEILPVRAQELLGRAAAAISGEAMLAEWPASAMRA
jgi:RNA polymerase sigma factor for flagellar operon FliA